MTDQTTPVLELGVPVVLAFSHQRIADMVTTALESPVGDWLKRAVVARTSIDSKPLDNHFPWYSQGAYWSQPAAGIECVVENPESNRGGRNKDQTLRMEDFQRALILMATKDEGTYSRHFADFLRSNEDANTADLFMQLAVYGEEVFA